MMVHRMNYLDGLRGLAALGVVAYHSNVLFSVFSWTEAYGDMPNLILSRFTNGNFFVCIFFILSGYVLVIPRVKNANVAGEKWGELAVRRYFRLTPIALASVALTCFLWTTLGIPNQILSSYGPGFAYTRDYYNFTPSFLSALYYGTIGLYTFFPSMNYNPVLWTMSIEMIGSLLLFSCLALYPKKKSFYFASGIVSLICLVVMYSFGVDMLEDGIYICLFFVGAILHLEQCTLRIENRILRILFLVVGIYLGGISIYLPEGEWLAKQFSLSPFLLNATVHSLAAILLILAVVSSEKLQNILSSAPLLWVGKISFSLYAIHTIVVFSIGFNLFIFLEPLLRMRMSALISYITIYVVSIILAWVLTKYIDLPSQSLSKRISAFFCKE